MSRRLIPALAVLALGASVAPADARVAYGSRVLQEGMSGSDVKVMQGYLTRVGVRTKADGEFGRRTTGKLEFWEERTGIKVNGRLSRRNANRLRQQVEAGGASYGNDVEYEQAPVEKATLAPDGTAVAPASAPQVVKDIIAAGNEIHDKPYKYGGGHGRWKDSGYDCSGSVSYALHFAGLLKDAMPSGSFTSWGRRGKGRWVTTYANSGHMYMVVAGLRFDTSGAKARGGSRWTDEMRSASGYVKRHPRGL